MRWEHVLDAVQRRQWRGVRLTGITEDTRRLVPGMVFVARQGSAVDGHAFLAEARARGAAFTVGERAAAGDRPDARVPDAARALALLVSLWHGHPARGLTLVAITGTNGKSTVAHLVATILRAAGIRAAHTGTLGYRFEGDTTPPTHTTPPAETLYPLLRRWKDAGATHVVMEVSAQALTQARVAACRFEAAAVTNFSRDHGEFYQDAAAYRAAKATLFRDLTTGVAVWPEDEPACAPFAAAAASAGLRPVTFGAEGDVRGDIVGSADMGGSVIRLTLAAHGAFSLPLPFPGRHNLRNAMCAAALALGLGVPAEAIALGLRHAEPIPGRGVLLRSDRGVTVVVDYAHNPVALRAVLAMARAGTAGRLLAVLGPRGDRDRGKRPLMGAILAAFADTAILTSDHPGSEDAAEAARPMLAAARDCGLDTTFVPNRAEAIAAAAARARPGDCLVITGKGSEPWSDDDGGWPGSTDVAVVLECLRQPAEAPAAAVARRA